MAKAAGARCGSGAQEGLGDRAERDEGQLCRRPRADRPPRWPCLAAIVLVEQAEFARPDQAVTGNLGARCAAPWLARWVSSGEGWGLLHGHRWGLSHGHGESFRARPSVSPSAGFDRKSADSRSDRHGAAFQADAMDRIHEGDLGLNPAGPPTVGSLAHRRPHLVGCQARQPGAVRCGSWPEPAMVSACPLLLALAACASDGARSPMPASAAARWRRTTCEPTIELLAPRYPTYAFDLPGFGWSFQSAPRSARRRAGRRRR